MQHVHIRKHTNLKCTIAAFDKCTHLYNPNLYQDTKHYHHPRERQFSQAGEGALLTNWEPSYLGELAESAPMNIEL